MKEENREKIIETIDSYDDKIENVTNPNLGFLDSEKHVFSLRCQTWILNLL